MQTVFEKIIERLEKLADELYKAYCIGFNSDDRAEYDAYINAIEIVKQEAEKYNSGWIPCSSGVLPKRSNSYCVTKMCENDGNPIYETCHEIFWTNDNKWDCERDEDCEWRVIAWKEKDKPYHPKGE